MSQKNKWLRDMTRTEPTVLIPYIALNRSERLEGRPGYYERRQIISKYIDLDT
jgi:hypothetical protein